MIHRDEFEPKLVFYREANITTLDSTEEWREAVMEKCREAGGSLRKLWLSQAKPLRVPLVSWREFQTFHTRLGLPYGGGEVARLGDYIDDQLPPSSDEEVVVQPKLVAEHGRGPKGQQSRLILRLGSIVLQENQLIRAMTQEFHDRSDVTDEVWGGPAPDILLAHAHHGTAQEVIGMIKNILQADSDLLVRQATLGPVYYEDNSEDLIAPVVQPSSAGRS